MAMLDYGAIAFKNGKLIQTEMFGEMKDMVGWEDTEADVYHNYHTNKDEPLHLNGNYFAYVGDNDCTLAFYKEQMVIAERYNDGTFGYHHEFFNCAPYTWSKWEKYAGIDDDYSAIVNVTKRNGYLVCKWVHKGDKYKVYFGYGVDLHYYKKYHVVNAYRGPVYWFMKLRNKIRSMKNKW